MSPINQHASWNALFEKLDQAIDNLCEFARIESARAARMANRNTAKRGVK